MAYATGNAGIEAEVLKFQRPGAPSSSLLNVLVDSARAARSGGAVVAWATRSGVRSLLGQPEFVSLLESGEFRLVVGTDSITDTRAVEELRSASERYSGLTVQFLVNEAMSLMHPKLWWFDGSSGAEVIVGSGNLTTGGLLGNWEAFAVVGLASGSRSDFAADIDDWLASIAPGLVDFDDPRLLAAIASNTGDERQVKRSLPKLPPAAISAGDVDMWLVAELNKNRTNSVGQPMFSQASFDKATFVSFFNYSGAETPLSIRSVDAKGTLGSVEARRGRYKPASVNYYFEIGAASGLPYPEEGRPIAVFGRVANGQYIYQLLLPGDAGHSEMRDWLEVEVGPQSTRMRRRVIDGATFAANWPGSSLLKVSLES